MIGVRPKFMSSPYFVGESDNWHLLPGAPANVVKEFNEFMEAKKAEYNLENRPATIPPVAEQ